MRYCMILAACLCGAAFAVEELETARWQSAIDETAKAGGGRVTVPAGRHRVGGLELRSNVELHLEKDAVLEGVAGLENYRFVELSYSEGIWSAVVMGLNVTNVAITGEGEIFGNGREWPQPENFGGNQEGRRARGVFFSESKDVRLNDFFLHDVGCWGIVFKCCDGVVVRRVRISNHVNANNDGFDIEAANATFEDCDVDAADDAFVLKSNNPHFAVTNVLVRNCTARSHCYALKFGTASHGVMADIRFENVNALPPTRDEFFDLREGSPNRGNPFWSERAAYYDFPAGVGLGGIAVECVDGGTVERVSFDNVDIYGYMVPIFVRGGTRTGRCCGTPPSDRHILRDITIRNVRGVAASSIASSVSGVDGCRVSGVTLENIDIVCRGAGEAKSREALDRPVPDVSGGYPCVTMFEHILPAYGLWVDKTDGLTMKNVRFRLRPDDVDFRPPVAGVEAVAASVVPTWPEAKREMKPWVYNWWMGSAVDETGLEHQSRELVEKGFGGFHVIPIYGAKGYEAKWRSYLSPEWMEAFAMAKSIGARHGLGVDLTMGSGWCFGGPWLEKSEGCVKLVKGDDGLLVPQPTGQMVKRAGPGGQGLMMNPFSPKAIDAFLKKFEVFDRPGVALPEHFYHDSYEYFEAAWSDELPVVFKARRGYDLMEKWDVFSGKGEPDEVARVKCDYRETLDDLIVEEVFPKWVEWCHARGVKARNEAHGSPVNWLDFYALADIPETEMFGRDCRDILISKFASSAAHVTRKPLVSAESCTWIAEHFTETLSEIKVFIDRLFLSGVNHMFYHGCCYSPVEAPWPGWCFYASLEMNPRNPIWRDVGTLNAYITRCQSIFQTCTPDNDLLVYWSIRDYWWDDDGCEKPMTVHDTKWFYGQSIGETAKRLHTDGYAFDYVSDRMLQNAERLGLSGRYAALEVPPCRHMPEKTKAAVAALALPDASKARREPFAAAGLMFTRFRKGADTVYFLVNQSGRTVSESLAPSCTPKSAWRMDPLTGEIEPLAVGGGKVTLTLDVGHSCILWCSPEATTVRTELAPRLWLDLGEVVGDESVRVTVNGKFLGTLIMPPYRIAIPDGVLKGRRIEDNDIVLDVCERGANRIRDLDRQGVKWKIFTDINMVDIGYNPFDAANWPVQKHGVKGPVRIVAP